LFGTLWVCQIVMVPPTFLDVFMASDWYYNYIQNNRDCNGCDNEKILQHLH